jgi:hypothetical protein
VGIFSTRQYCWKDAFSIGFKEKPGCRKSLPASQVLSFVLLDVDGVEFFKSTYDHSRTAIEVQHGHRLEDVTTVWSQIRIPVKCHSATVSALTGVFKANLFHKVWVRQGTQVLEADFHAPLARGAHDVEERPGGNPVEGKLEIVPLGDDSWVVDVRAATWFVVNFMPANIGVNFCRTGEHYFQIEGLRHNR